MNKFGHLKKQERLKLFMPQKAHQCYQDEDPVYVGEYLPEEYDFRRDGVVSYVKDQDRCHASYAFSAVEFLLVGAIESQFALHTGILPDLSEQDVVSCSKKYGNNGCKGGSPEKVFKYCTAEGISTSIDYPYRAKESRCRQNHRKYSYHCVGYRKLTRCDEQNLSSIQYWTNFNFYGCNAQ
ncbi:LOW QUALITY PROTEIN: hypothetical protein MXB_5091 [Myxobolus squamalis]|nr:LOW QUALITY PROTEIN: hypothetical protein MXB_5091 [Myxobolus squamalis]